MVLKPEWTLSMLKMMKYIDNKIDSQGKPVNNENTIQVTGNLVNIQANIKDENDMNKLTRKIENVLKDKFNIKK